MLYATTYYKSALGVWVAAVCSRVTGRLGSLRLRLCGSVGGRDFEAERDGDDKSWLLFKLAESKYELKEAARRHAVKRVCEGLDDPLRLIS